MQANSLIDYLGKPTRITSAELAADVEAHLKSVAEHPMVVTCSYGPVVIFTAARAAQYAAGLFEAACDILAEPGWEEGLEKSLRDIESGG
jgi:hypothetical protein